MFSCCLGYTTTRPWIRYELHGDIHSATMQNSLKVRDFSRFLLLIVISFVPTGFMETLDWSILITLRVTSSQELSQWLAYPTLRKRVLQMRFCCRRKGISSCCKYQLWFSDAAKLLRNHPSKHKTGKISRPPCHRLNVVLIGGTVLGFLFCRSYNTIEEWPGVITRWYRDRQSRAAGSWLDVSIATLRPTSLFSGKGIMYTTPLFIHLPLHTSIIVSIAAIRSSSESSYKGSRDYRTWQHWELEGCKITPFRVYSVGT